MTMPQRKNLRDDLLLSYNNIYIQRSVNHYDHLHP